MVLASLVGVLLVGLAVCVGYAGANSPRADQQYNSQMNQSQQAQSPKKQTFTGKITRNARDHSSPAQSYVLQEDASRHGSFYLDNETEAAKYDGLKVRVTGTLDTSGKTIHVISIKEL
jgi:hypothetical protein